MDWKAFDAVPLPRAPTSNFLMPFNLECKSCGLV
jgi:hypothetical protein